MKNLVVALSITCAAFASAAQSPDRGKALCREIQSMIDKLVDYTKTECIPAAGSKAGLSFIVVAMKPVFHVEAAKKGWALVAVTAVGHTLNKSPSVKVDELWLSDANEMKERTAYVMRVDKAKSIQSRAKADKFDSVDQMYSEISSSLTRKKIP